HAPWLFLLQLVSRLCMVSHQFQGRLRMNYTLIPKELRPIAEKIEAKARISEDDALALYRSNDLNALGMLANVVRERKNGKFATSLSESSRCRSRKRSSFSAKPALAPSLAEAPKFLMPQCETGFAAAKKRPRSGLMFTEFGIAWVAAALAPCFMVTSRLSSSVSIIYGNFVNFRMKPADLAVLFHLP